MLGALLSDGLVRFLIDATTKATLLLLLSCVIAGTLRRSSAAIRHRLWALTLCGLIALPVVSWLIPGWRLPVLPAAPRLTEAGPSTPTIVQTESDARIASNIVLAPTTPARVDVKAPVAPRRIVARPVSRSIPVGKVTTRTNVAIKPEATWTIAGGLLAGWGIGAIAILLPTVLCVVANEWRRRRAPRVTGDDWLLLLETLRRSFAIGRPVELRRSEVSPIPMTWGVVRPVVLLPDDAGRWGESTRRLVLLHELAHVQRFDAGFQLVGRFAAALYWFHPLAWYALHRLRLECEHACDDCVVGAGERPTDYARQLLDLARSLRVPRVSLAVAMARTNTLEQRMRILFDEKRSHVPLGRRSGRLLAVGAALLVVGLATAHPGPSAAEPNKPTAEVTKGSGQMTGVVNDQGGTAVQGATVILLLPPPKGESFYYGKLPLRQTTTDAKGAFTFSGLTPGRHRVWANFGKLTSRNRSSRGEVVIVPESGEMPKPVALRLHAGVAVTARVKDKATGKPLPNATVELGWSDFPDPFTAGRDGLVRVQPLTAERWLVEAWADGFGKVSRWLNLENGSDADEEFLLVPGGDLEGVVRESSGEPLSGAGLSVFLEGSNEQYTYVETDKSGRYRLEHLPLNTPLTINFSKVDYLSDAIPTQLKNAKESLDIKVARRPDGGAIAGVIRDGKGRPIAGAELVNTGRSTAEVRQTKTGPDGRFRLENLFEGSVGKEVLVRAKGFAPKRVKVEPGPADKPAEVTIDLEPGHRINGQVTDDKSRPLEGVNVYFAHGNHAFSDGGETKTDAKGRFTFDSLPANTPFAFNKEGYSEIADRQLPLDTDDLIVVEMVPAGVIVGKVLDAKTGKPVRTFNVRITFSPKRQPGDPSTGLLSYLSNPGQTYQSNEGRFRLQNLVAGMPLQVMISAEGYERHVTERVEAARPDDAPLEQFRLDPIDPADLRTYRGRLIDAEEKPVAGAQVRLIAARNRDPSRRWEFPFNWDMIHSGQLAQQSNAVRFLESVTDAQGRFEFTRIPKNTEVELAWWRKGIAPGRADHLEQLSEKENESIEITIPAAGRIVGTIDRKAFGNAGRIQASESANAFGFIDLELKPNQTDFEIDDLPPGKYNVILMTPFERVPGRPGQMTTRTITSAKVTVSAGEAASVDFK